MTFFALSNRKAFDRITQIQCRLSPYLKTPSTYLKKMC